MPVVVWKMHHPCFLDFFCLSHVDVDFRLHSDSFYLWGFADIVFAAYNASFAVLPGGNDHCSNAVLSNRTGRQKKLDDTNHIEFDVKVKSVGLRSCKQPEDVLEKRYCGGASGCLR